MTSVLACMIGFVCSPALGMQNQLLVLCMHVYLFACFPGHVEQQ